MLNFSKNPSSNSARKSKSLATYGVLIALAFVLSMIESMLPLPLPVWGAKVGLANLVTMVGLYTIGIRGTVLISLSRILLAGFTFGNMYSLCYSLAGWVWSILVMTGMKRSGLFGQTGISVMGGIAHNLGQLAVAAWLVKSLGVLSYLPFLLFAGVGAGSLIGLLGGILTSRIRQIGLDR